MGVEYPFGADVFDKVGKAPTSSSNRPGLAASYESLEHQMSFKCLQRYRLGVKVRRRRT
jgi:hypothetical protein